MWNGNLRVQGRAEDGPDNQVRRRRGIVRLPEQVGFGPGTRKEQVYCRRQDTVQDQKLHKQEKGTPGSESREDVV